MNTEKIMGAVGVLVCAINFFATTPVSAVASVEKQEAYAHKLAMKNFNGVISESEEARKLLPILNGIEKRICDVNGLKITSQRFQNDYDFETKLHPVQMVDTNDAHAGGAGYIYIGVQNVVNTYKAQNFRNQYDYFCMEKMLAHEITHNIEGHTLRWKGEADAELKAEKGSVRLTDALPEGGWGVYLVGVNRKQNRPEQNEQVMASFEKEAKQRIKIERADKVYYCGSDGKDYLIMSEGYYFTTPCEDNAYFGGQVAYCIAKGAFRPENIQIAPNNLQDIKFEGDYLLICRSPKLPNGYRVLTGLYGDYKTLGNCLNGVKMQVQNKYPLPVFYDSVAKTISKYRDEHPIEKAYCQIWMACAIAQDNANR